MALIILGVLAVLGIVFIAMINRNIRGSVEQGRRSIAYDLAEAGIRYVHDRMLNSDQLADWRPSPTVLPIPINDPDYEFLRLPNPADPTDQGGPDKKGFYSRLPFDRGRALVRVRYAPSDPTIFSTTRVGDLFQPGLARNYTIIESVGKSGNFLINDPTSVSTLQGVSHDVTESKKLIGFVSCGLIEQARFITNKFHVSAPAEMGWPTNPGVAFDDTGGTPSVVQQVPIVLGNSSIMYNPYDPSLGGSPTQTAGPIPYGGGFYCNDDLLIYGNVYDNINSMLGDSFLVAGSISGADNQSKLTLNYVTPNAATNSWNPPIAQAISNPQLNSNSPTFSTFGGLLKDDFPNGDSQGFPRGIPTKDPPSIERTDPATGLTRYVQMTQLSGKQYVNALTNLMVNAGAYGHGAGVYVNNSAGIQVPTDEQGREDVGAAESLVYDWLNPNNGEANTGWQGAFYVPHGAVLRLQYDGFTIVREQFGPANQRTWMEPDGSPSKRPGAQMTSTNPADIVASPTIRYKLVYDPQTGQNYIFNSYSVEGGSVINLNNITTANVASHRAAGYPFNGVVYFAGNVRVRGQIPTDMQLTVVSNATIYIEGSITKGVINNGTRNNVNLQAMIKTPSKSMLALLAKDYITLNTTQFFGTSPGSNVDIVKDSGSPTEWNPLRVKTGGNINFINEFVLDPNTPASKGGNPNDPSTLLPFAMDYTPAGAPNGFENSNLLIAHTMDNGPAPDAFINMNVNYPLLSAFPDGTGQWQYLFPLSANNGASLFYPAGYVQPDYTVPNQIPLYGLGGQSWQRYSKFESDAFPIVTNDFTYLGTPSGLLMNGSNTSPSGLYHLLVEETNDFVIGTSETVGGTPTNDYVVARAAIVPQDILIEATLFAEDGSFFVIPGQWFNPNPNDRRDYYLSLGATQFERDNARLEQFGSTPNTPFYGEPLDVRISIFGSVTENMPPPIGQQAEWMKKWGWIPRDHGASGELIPQQHVPSFVNPATNLPYNVNGADQYVPNIIITYDPALATDRNSGFVGAAGPAVDVNTMIRYQAMDINGDGIPDVYYALPPIPRLPVSPTLAYFGEVNQ